MNATAITQAAAAVQKAERRHEYAIDALLSARNAHRPTAYLEAELLRARAEWVAAEVAGAKLLERRMAVRSVRAR